MQKHTLNLLLAGQGDADLVQTWRLLKRDAQINKLCPQVRFSSQMLPAYYASQVTNVFRTPCSGWLVKSSLPALSGNQGTLPRAMYRKVLSTYFNLGDEAAADFFDIFNNRYFHLYCQVEQKHCLPAQVEEEYFSWNHPCASITGMLISLYGGSPTQVHAIQKSDLIKYSGLVGLKLTSPQALQDILQDYFSARFEIEYTVLEYRLLSFCSLTKIGKEGQNQKLGMGALIGKSVAMVGQKLNIKICPSNYRHFLDIRNDQNLVMAINHIVRVYMGDNIKFRLYMKVSSQYLPRVMLSQQTNSGVKISQSAWMDSRCGIEEYVELPLSVNWE